MIQEGIPQNTIALTGKEKSGQLKKLQVRTARLCVSHSPFCTRLWRPAGTALTSQATKAQIQWQPGAPSHSFWRYVRILLRGTAVAPSAPCDPPRYGVFFAKKGPATAQQQKTAKTNRKPRKTQQHRQRSLARSAQKVWNKNGVTLRVLNSSCHSTDSPESPKWG